MPKLKCKVEQCIYNYDWLCGKNYIDVDGPDAKTKKETRCSSINVVVPIIVITNLRCWADLIQVS